MRAVQRQSKWWQPLVIRLEIEGGLNASQEKFKCFVSALNNATIVNARKIVFGRSWKSWKKKQ